MIKVSDNVAKVYHKDFMTVVRHEITAGGRASTKTSRNAAKIICSMLQNKDEEWIVVRQNYAHHVQSTYLELKIALDRLGLTEGVHYTARENPLQIKMHTGSTIRFGGMDDFRKLKGYTKTKGCKYIGGVWFFEIDEFKGPYGITQTIATFVRGKKPRFTCIYEYNPPEIGSWVYSWVEEMKKREDTLYLFVNYNDLTKWEQENWLGAEMLSEIEESKKMNYELYENVYLGRPRILQGACYPRQIPDMLKGKIKFEYINVGIDYGDNDATTAVAVGIAQGKFYIIGHYYTKDSNKLITDKEREIVKWLNDLRNKYAVGIDVYCETNPQTLYIMLKQNPDLYDGIYIRKVDKRKEFAKSVGAVQERIDALNVLIGREAIQIDEDLQLLKKAMLEARYNKNGSRVDDGSSDIDSLDALEYAIKSEVKFILSTYYKE